MLSPSLEDYLEEIYRLSLWKDKIRVTDIANQLNVSLPSVVNALKKLNNENYICYEPHSEITLTREGKKLGKLLVKRNAMLQDFLKTINSNCDIAKEAEAMEHYLSSSTILAIERLLKFLKSKPIKSMFAQQNKPNAKKHWSKDIESL